MSQLIQIRQRIKAIETIKKITHAMRLISMSSHALLKNKQSSAGVYVESLRDILSQIQQGIQKTEAETTNTANPEKKLIIVIGSQKGLCGSFNTNLLVHFNHVIQSEDLKKTSFLIIGNRIIDAIKAHPITIIKTISSFSLKNVAEITETIQDLIPQFSSVICISNQMKSFFIQEPQTTIIDPYQETDFRAKNDPLEYLWELSAQDMNASLIPHYYEAYLSFILLQSLLAEHAARFIAMDNATRNARTLLDEKKLEYNKLRQALITKELTELSGIFSA